ncbi:uncharacterized protein PV09_05594 [Verruconis gallopava]|uniref:ER-bound oxygenase mpaB/mpaB'/Rubber oxygenase catalytic domain-containing protein n=1 Tax=Verruconis gallopava TaxID=253628 RepID=A0A0D1YRY7_9PEZI|nr:uncharacterized protein PV09_05594 [Verruconis gallopava]KIW03387.1 hypothetical protein PV09_05594 [Verruconis gallopava]
MSATTTETLLQRKTLVVEKTDDHRQELISRGLLNSNYPLIKKVVSEQMVVSIAALTAVLLQIAHPGVGKGVGLHSNFAYRFVERHENTVMYIYTMIFGTEEQKAKMKAFVDKRHKYVNDNKKGKTYDALDPKLQLWVAFTLYATYVPVYEEIFGNFSDEEREQVLQEFSIMGTSLQVPLSMWPRSVAEADEYWNHTVNEVLEITEPCKKTTNELRNAATYVPWYLKPLMMVTVPAHWNATTERLPARAQEMYGLQSTLWTRTFDAIGMTYLKWTYPYLPMSVRTFQVNYYMNLAQKLMTKGRLA